MHNFNPQQNVPTGRGLRPRAARRKTRKPPPRHGTALPESAKKRPAKMRGAETDALSASGYFILTIGLMALPVRESSNAWLMSSKA